MMLALLALGDVACNLAAFRLNTFGRVPIPTGLHAASTASAALVAVIALLGRGRTNGARTRRSRAAALGATLVIGGAIVGGVTVFTSLAGRALQPFSAAQEACHSPATTFGRPPRDACITREEAKPVGTTAFFIGIGGLGAMALGTGMLFASASARTATPVRLALGCAFLLVAIAGLTLTARAGAKDLDRLYLAGGPRQSCDRPLPAPATRATVITAEEQAFRDCVVAAHGTNPWRAPFWGALGVALPATIASGISLPVGPGRREESSLHGA
jgi:hypothetical protein